MRELTYIGIGASAGGLKALEQLVELLPLDQEFVYIVAQHFDPSKESNLAEILARHTKLELVNVTKSTHFRAKNIYIIPAGFDLVLKKNSLTLQESFQGKKYTPTPSVDTLFETLALYKGERSVGIVLTGSGDDGREGIQKIRESKGITIAQNPAEAQYSSMPQSAIDTACVDYILSLEEMAQQLATIVQPSSMTPFGKIKNLLYTQKNIDIDKYKEETILRRVEKRMLLLNLETLEMYVKYIETHKEELHLLYQNILIGVTEFFRDKESFEKLSDTIYSYLEDKPEDYELKVWSIACSTGEEAYSLAILIDQVSQKLQKHFNVKIFASDIDLYALSKARSGVYTEEAIENLASDTLTTYFEQVDNSYRVINRIRKNIVFTQHNVLSDPPFMNQDLISCRNLLIYIKTEIQEEIFALMHFALKEDGLLFLGSSESTLLNMKYFTPQNLEHKIFVKDRVQNPPKLTHRFVAKNYEQRREIQAYESAVKKATNIDEKVVEIMVQHLLPNCIVLDKELNIVYKKGSLDYVTMPDGLVSLNILDYLHSSLKYAVKRVIALSFEETKHHSTSFIEVNFQEKSRYVKVIAYPYYTNKNSMILLYFEELYPDELEFDVDNLNLPNESFLLESLSTQLHQVKRENNLLEDKLTIYQENMQLLNEELQSSNEELQSSNEELETSNEELQSSNEELHNSVLNQTKLQEKLSGILNATQNGIVGLDLKGNHIFVNDATCKLLGFSREELISHNAHTLWHHTKADGSFFPSEECKLHQHLKNKRSIRTKDLFWKKDGTPIDVEVMQNPLYENNEVIGAVLSFEDITEKKRLQKEAEDDHKLTELYLNTISSLLMTLDIDGNITMINEEGAKLLGLPQRELIGKNWFDNFLPNEIKKEVKKVFHSLVSGSDAPAKKYTNTIVDVNQQEYTIFWTSNYTKDEYGEINGVISSGVNITKEEEMSKKLSKQEHLYKMTFEEANIGIGHTSLDGVWIDTNEYMSELLGYTKEEFLHLSITDITYEGDVYIDKRMSKKLLKNKQENYHLEKRYIHKNGTIIWVALSVVLLRDENGTPLYFLKIIRDISELKMLIYTLEAEKNKFETMVDFTPTPILIYNEEGEIILLNKKYQEVTGISKNVTQSIEELIEILFKDEDKESLEKIKAYYQNPTLQKDIVQNITTSSGEKRVGILNGVTIDDISSNNTKIYIVAIVDITDLQKKDELMIAQSRQAAMGDMLAMIAHQWRQPLSVISMLGNNIKVELELDEEVTRDDLEYLTSSLEKQTQYLSHTIDDFRNFFKPDQMQEIVKVDTLIEKVNNLMLKSLENNNIAFALPKESDIKVSIYKNQLLQVLINLVNNAKDAILSKSIIDGKIRIDVEKKKSQVVISVCDNGGGIEKSVIDKIGEAYVSTKSKNGTGLGLYMSIQILENHLGGSLTWKNSNKGACFYISLPVI